MLAQRLHKDDRVYRDKLKKKKFESFFPQKSRYQKHTHTYIMPNLTKMNVQVSVAEWNALLARLAVVTARLNAYVEAEKKELAKTKQAQMLKVLDKAEKAEKTRLARNLKERCRHLLVGKTNSARRKWYDSASQSERNARVQEILIEVGIKEAPEEEEEE